MSMKKFDIRYERTKIKPGILHFGVGNFHRAHAAYYTNKLLIDSDQQNWGICGAMILARDERLYRSFVKQDGSYGLTVFGRNGQDEHHLIGSMIELLWGIEDASAIIDKVADPAIKIISLTITEGGYNLDRVTRRFDFSHDDIQHDLSLPAKPRTVFGYIAAGLIKRIDNGAGPLTIMTCDNLPHNGNVCRDSFMAFFERADSRLHDWAKKSISFPNTMVDRITPATLPEDHERLQQLNGFHDEAPVYCEDFVQWVIEDNFMAGRPAWERVGVEFTDDVSSHEDMKLGYVNSTHQMLSFPAFLAGYRKVDEAVADPRIADYLRIYMDLDVTPYLTAPANTDLAIYRKTFMERLANPAVSDQLARLCFDAANKIPVFFRRTVNAMIQAEADMQRIAYFIAAYRLYLRRGKDEKGISYQINDPGLQASDRNLIRSEQPLDFLDLSCLSDIKFQSSDSFIKQYLQYCQTLETKPILSILERN